MILQKEVLERCPYFRGVLESGSTVLPFFIVFPASVDSETYI